MLKSRDKKFLSILNSLEVDGFDQDVDYTFILDQISAMVQGYV